MPNQIVPFFSFEGTNDIPDLVQAVQRVIKSQKYVLGDEVMNFEREFANYCGVQYCVTLANGTDALELSLRALDVQKGDSVLMVANAGFYGSTAARLIGAIPYYIDIDPATLTMSIDHLSHALAQKPKAIIVTHLYGQLAHIEKIIELAQIKGIPVIEDCAQAHGAIRNGKRVGSFGTIGSFSFYPTKNLGALGDGGAIVTSNEAIAKRIKQLRQYGWSAKYHVDFTGGRNSRLDEIQAAILREKLPHLDKLNAQRRQIAQKYNEAFADLPIQCPSSTGDDYVAHLYVIQVENREQFQEHMKASGVMTDIHYPIADYEQKAYEAHVDKNIFPHTEYACTHVISLPCYPGMTSDHIEKVIQNVRQWFDAGVLKKTCC